MCVACMLLVPFVYVMDAGLGLALAKLGLSSVPL
jgi:hypothetical protein